MLPAYLFLVITLCIIICMLIHRESTSSRSKISSDKWIEHVRTAFAVDPRIALSLTSRFPTNSTVTAEVTQLVQVIFLWL